MTVAAIGTFGAGDLAFVSEAYFHDNPEIANVMLTNAGETASNVSDSVTADESEPADKTEPQPMVIPAYTYGGASPFVFGGSGMLSNADIMLWVEAHSGAVSDQLRERMQNADIRNKIVQDLTHLKSLVNKTADAEALRAEAAELVAAYEGTPFIGEVKEAVDLVLNNPDDAFGKDEMQRMTGALDSVIDKFGKDDQFDMIAIQDLTSRIREFVGAGSNMMSSNHQTMMAILGNIGR